MGVLIQIALLIVSALTFGSCAHDLSESYPFKAILNPADKGGLYELYWTFDNEASTISFAVRVETTGWVGFGLSPNGQMPNSDVVIGWVKNGETTFHDRFAPGRVPPVIDEKQDWELMGGEEESGFTILEFSRKYITCDDKDLPITAETANVLWSFSTSEDPSSEKLSSANIHTYKGADSLNLLGGLPSAAPDPADLQYFDATVDGITIPDADTTYWCAAFKLPEEIRTQTRYITKYTPEITEGNEAHVHHLLIYECDDVGDENVGNGDICNRVANEVSRCRGDTLIAGWAVGGEEFQYPDNVAYPFGGPGSPQYLVMELHYDNPDMISDTVDSSGIRFHYTSTAREFDAGILEVGHKVKREMIVPPETANYTVASICIADCTSKYFPEDGIHIFANLLHTHIVGRGLTLQHLRYNSECNVYEELEPIDRNLRYDFNYQQYTHLSRTRTVLRGDILLLKCFYTTEGVNTTTIGGLSTHEEMCLSFPAYYPKIPLTTCLSTPRFADLQAYAIANFPPEALNLLGENKFQEGLDAVDWTDDVVKGVQAAWLDATLEVSCNAEGNGLEKDVKLPEISCSYIPPVDTCTGYEPPTCCERINGVEGSGVALVASVTLLLLLSVLATIM